MYTQLKLTIFNVTIYNFILLPAEVCYAAESHCKAQKANDVLKVLIKHGVDVNEDPVSLKYTILHYTVQRGEFKRPNISIKW